MIKPKMSQWLGVLLTGVITLQSATVFAKPLHFKVAGGNGNKVAFTSDAPVEVIQGNTSHVNGDVVLDDSFQFDAKHPFKINFDVDLSTIDTGIELRNEHMRDNFLETGKYPKATFTATSIKMEQKPNLKKAQTVQLVSKGDFTLHGVTVQKTIPLKVTYTPAAGKKAASIQIQGKFPVSLLQHQIKIPEAVFVKLAKTVFVDLNLIGSTP